MKRQYLSLIASATLLLLLFQSVSSGRAASGGQDRTGSPGSLSSTCVACHSSVGSFTNPLLGISVKDVSGNAVSSYIAGDTYTLEFQVTTNGNPSGYAMQAVILDGSNSNIGDLSNVTTANTQLATIANGREFIEHAGRSSSGFFSCSWTAPIVGTGTISVYGIGMAVNGGSTSGDNTSPTAQLDLAEDVSTATHSILSDTQYSIHPMPNRGSFRLVNNQIAGLSEIRLISMQGQELYNQTTYLDQNATQNIVLNDLSVGLYFVQVTKAGKTQSIPMLIQQ